MQMGILHRQLTPVEEREPERWVSTSRAALQRVLIPSNKSADEDTQRTMDEIVQQVKALTKVVEMLTTQ